MKKSIPVIIAIFFAFTSVHAEPEAGKTASPEQPVKKTGPGAPKNQKKPEALKGTKKPKDIRDSAEPSAPEKKPAEVKKQLPVKKNPAAPAAGKKPKRNKEAKKPVKADEGKKAEKLKEPGAGRDIRDPLKADKKKNSADSGERKDQKKPIVQEMKKKPAVKKAPVKDIRDAKAAGDKNVSPERKEAKDLKDITAPHVIVINPGSSDAASFSASWGHVRDSRAIYNWGRNLLIFLHPDSGPVSDGLAAYLGPEGTTILDGKGQKPEAAYSLWIDFAVFRNPDRVVIPSTLKVFVSGGQYAFRELAGFTFNEMKPGAVRISIPYELTVSGDMRIMLKEYSQGRNTWAVWDIILSDSTELPPIAVPAPDNKGKKRLEPRHNILE
jgi:hypothetical protein